MTKPKFEVQLRVQCTNSPTSEAVFLGRYHSTHSTKYFPLLRFEAQALSQKYFHNHVEGVKNVLMKFLLNNNNQNLPLCCPF